MGLLVLYESFLTIASEKSFSRAATKLGLQKSTLSRHLSQLEEKLGTSLISRTTRAMHLTEAGTHLLKQIEDPILALQRPLSPETGGSFSHGEPRGTLKISAPVVLGQTVLATAFARFIEKYPRVTLDLRLEDRMVDLVAEGYDLAIRTGHLTHRTFKALKLGTTRFALYASPSYLESHGAPKSARDLLQHSRIEYWPSDEPFVWTLLPRRGSQNARRPATRVNALELALELCANGAGIALLPSHLVQDGLISGSLKQVLPHWSTDHSPYYAVYTATKNQALRVLLDTFKDTLKAQQLKQ